MLPVNRDFIESDTGITIYIVSSAVHADIIIPKEALSETQTSKFQNALNRANFADDISNITHIAFGWGDRGFFLNTQTWDDLTLSTAAKAVFYPSDTVMHIDHILPRYYADKVSLTLNINQFKNLITFISSSFETDENQEIIHVENFAYSSSDAFFVAKGSYHLLNTCNTWVAQALRSAGVKVPWLAPLPKSPMIYF